MKTLELAVLSSIVFLGCSPVESVSLNIVKGYMAAQNAHNAPRTVQFLIDNAVYYDAAAGESINGKEKVEKEAIGAFIKAVPDLSRKMAGKPIYDEDTVASHWESSGKNNGEWVGSLPTNNPIRLEGASHIHVKVGKITWRSDHYDSKKLGEGLKSVKWSAVSLYK